MNAAWSALLNASLLSVPLTAAGWLALRLLPRRKLNAATRYVIWWLLLVLTFVLPWIFPAVRGVRPVPPPVPLAMRSIQVPPTISAGPQPAPAASRIRLPFEIPSGRWMTWMLAVWSVTSAVLLLRLALSYRAVRRAASCATDIPELQE